MGPLDLTSEPRSLQLPVFTVSRPKYITDHMLSYPTNHLQCCRYLSDTYKTHLNIRMARQMHKQSFSHYLYSRYLSIHTFLYLFIY